MKKARNRLQQAEAVLDVTRKYKAKGINYFLVP